MESEITTKICESTSIHVVVIHTKCELYWILEAEVRWLEHSPLPPSSACIGDRGTNYTSTNRAKQVLNIYIIYEINFWSFKFGKGFALEKALFGALVD